LRILQQLLEELKTDDKLQQIRELCDQIQEEEFNPQDHNDHKPVGPNIFLALEVPGRTSKEIAFLTLERESADLYLAVFYTMPLLHTRMPEASLKRQKVWEINDHRPEKILTEYAKVNKFLRGE
jgi:hypothetical protein